MFDMKLTNKSLKIYLDYLKPMLVGTHLTLLDFFTREDLVFYFAKSDPSSLVLSLNGSQARLILTNRFPRFRGGVNSFLDKLKKELGKWFLDIAKYMTTAVLLASLFSGMDEWAWYMYGLVVLAVLITLATGLTLLKDKKEDN